MTGVRKDSDTLTGWTAQGKVMVGLDLGDKQSHWCACDEAGALRTGVVEVTHATQ